jgi:hypothetical protein
MVRLRRHLGRVAVGAVLGGALLCPTAALAQAPSCDPTVRAGCALPGWDDPLPADCRLWEGGPVMLAPPYPCLPPLGPRTP